MVLKPSLFCERLRRMNSPYINHFLSADTVIPGYANPQDLNRYSYVNNNPLRYTDPTGHMRVEEAGSKRGCSDPKYCQNGKPKPREKNKDKKKSGGQRDTLDYRARTEKGYLQSWEGEKDIDPGDWDMLRSEIRDDVHSSWGTFLPIEAPRMTRHSTMTTASFPAGVVWGRNVTIVLN